MIRLSLGEPLPAEVSASMLVRIPPGCGDETLEYLRQEEYQGVLWLVEEVYADEGEDLERAYEMADVVVFWFPKCCTPVTTLMAEEFAHNVSRRQGGMVLGLRRGLRNANYMRELAGIYHIQETGTLANALEAGLDFIGQGALRQGGETMVPLYLWRTDSFQRWLQSVKEAGNRLDDFSPRLLCQCQPGMGHEFQPCWGAEVKLWVEREQRHWSGEIALGHPDTLHVVAFHRPKGGRRQETLILLSRSFHGASAGDGVRRSTLSEEQSQLSAFEKQALHCARTTTQLAIRPQRLHPLSTRHLAGEVSTQQGQCFTLELNETEVDTLREGMKSEVGDLAGIEFLTVAELLARADTDWANLGMILSAVFASTKRKKHKGKDGILRDEAASGVTSVSRS